MKCNTCKNNWTKLKTLGIEELSKALEKCSACTLDGFKFYESAEPIRTDESGKEKPNGL